MKDNGFKLAKERSRSYPAETTMDVVYADDIVLLANITAQAETLLDCLKGAAACIGFHVNADKTEYMYFNQRGDFSTLNGSSLNRMEAVSHQPREMSTRN